MASRNDKLFQKRKALGKDALRRKNYSREKRRRLLVVTEGEVTEPMYFEHLRQLFGLTSVDVDVCGDCDSSPIDVVRYAKNRAELEGHWEAGGYDQVYCVFDRDNHESFERAKSEIYNLNKSNRFPAKRIDCICSFPCFEYWLLLHFTFSRAAFVGAGNQSSCDMVLRELKKVTGSNTIGKTLSTSFLEALMQRLEQAIENAKKSEADFQATGEPNPTTAVHLLVTDMQKLKREIDHGS